MISTFINAWKIADLRKKMLFTALIVVIFRIGAAIPVPFTNIIGDNGIIDPTGETFMNYLAMMTGEAFAYGTIFALSITPYINSSIIIQLLSVAIPYLEKLSKEGEEGRKKIATITRYTTVALALLQSTAYFIYLRSQGYIVTAEDGSNFTGVAGVFVGLAVILCLTAGSTFVMWLGEQVNEKGIGNGISIILFAGIVSRIPTIISSLWYYIQLDNTAYYALVPTVVICLLAMIAFIVWMDNAERRIPVQYAKRVVGRKMYGGQSTHIPIKVNMSGVLPVIFASSILSLPPTVEMFLKEETAKKFEGFFKLFSTSHWFYSIIYFILILFFAYFYASIQYNPVEMANNIRKNSGMIPGLRPGKPTADYIKKILGRITLLGALLLSVVALFPNVITLFTNLIGAPMTLSLGGTSLIIVVGVALETVKQLESQMMMRHYKGFLD